MRITSIAGASMLLLAACGSHEESTPTQPAATQPAAPSGPTALAIGTPATVRFQPATAGAQAETAAQTLRLTVARAGSYQCTAHAQGMDAQMAIRRNGAELTRDSDSAGNFDARFTQQLAPGTYDIQVWEWQNRAAPITVTCIDAPAAAGNVLTLGVPSTVTLQAGEGTANQQDLTLAITAQGPYTCDAHMDGLDAQLSILQNGAVIQQDSDSGDGTDARIARELSPGAYQVRVSEWMHRAGTASVRCYPGLTPPGT